MADESCTVFGRLSGSLDRNKIHRFLVGADSGPRPMHLAEAQAELGDPFATLLLLKGVFPRTAQECLDKIRAAQPNGRLSKQMIFLLGETSQLQKPRHGLRFVITLGADANGPPEGPDILLSVSSPDQSDIELMAWDRKRGGFNYYRAVGAGPTWVFAGNARAALVDPTQGKGPFESHKSGAFLMKELKLPWVNWDSPEAPIAANAFPPGQRVAKEKWFPKRQPGGAYAFEFEVARPAIERWAKARFDEIEKAGTVNDPRRIMEQLLTTPTMNLASSNVESRRATTSGARIDLPPSFFADVDSFGEVGIAAGDFLEVAPKIYTNALEGFKVRLEHGGQRVQKGDTHFAFPVPERAFEDVVTLREAIRVGLVTRRLAACLLMVDFPNPIFSQRRAKLLEHVPDSASIANGKSGFSRRLANAILRAAEMSPEGSPEREFAERWRAGTKFEAKFNRALSAYFRAVKKRLKTQQGFNAYWRLADARRREARKNPVFREFDLVFPKSTVPKAARRMRADGMVV